MNPDHETASTSPIEHQNVPQEHRSLHDFLYSAADEHGAPAAPTPDVAVDQIISIAAWCDETQNAKVAGVYAVFDRDQQPQYVGYSRNVTLYLRNHLLHQGETCCAFVKVRPFKFPKRVELEQLRDQWIAELPNLPPANLSGDGNWANTLDDATQSMSAVERAAYEEKKLKLRRAMADGTLQRELLAAQAADPAQTQTSAEQQAFEAKIQDDNWSAVINEQSEETVVPLSD